MNEQAILHITDSQYCFPLDTHSLVLRLRVDRRDEPEKVEVIYESKYVIYEKQCCAAMEKKYEDRLYAYYEIRMQLEDVRLAYVFRIWEHGKGYYFSEDGISESYNFALGYFNFFQFPYINEVDIHKEVEWMEKAVFYEIFIDRFYCGAIQKERDYINLKWGEKPKSKSFAGGDIPGITKKLDYIRDLGVNVLYLTPIFRSVSNHKYDISDYHVLDEHFGTNEDFKKLVEKAHEKGIRVVLDAVFNHCSEHLPQFQDVLRNGKKSPYFDWFIVNGEKPDSQNLNYEVFAFCEYMPKFNTSNQGVQEFLLDVAVSWIQKYDIDGWRLDVSDEVSHDFWRTFRKRVKGIKKDCVIIGENWHNANTFLKGDQYDSIMNYAFTKACLDYFAFDTFTAQGFAWKLNELLMRNTEQVNAMMLNLLDSHDTDRFYTSVGQNKDKVLSAVAVMCMFTGAPCIYYGTEILLEGGYDPDNRRCFDWDKVYQDKTFWKLFTELLKLRQSNITGKGEINITARKDLLLLNRRLAGEELTLAVNQSGNEVTVNLKGELLLENHLVSERLQTDGFLIYKGGLDALLIEKTNNK